MKSTASLALAAATALVALAACGDSRDVESTGEQRAKEGAKEIVSLAFQAARNVASHPETALQLKADAAFRDYVDAQCAYRAYRWHGTASYEGALRTCAEQLRQERVAFERGETAPARGPLVLGEQR